MRTLTGFLFPDTVAYDERLYPLLLVCAPLMFLQPVEDDPDESAPGDRDLFIKHGLCQPHTPAPLGRDRQRFLRLLDDIRLRGDDYAAQLSTLTMAAMSAPRAADDEKRHRIISALLSGASPGGTDTMDGGAAELWQARLVLSLAEILAAEEAELRDGLQQLSRQEMEMFSSLRGGDDEIGQDRFAEIKSITSSLEQGREQSMRLRCKAWLTLMAAGPTPDVDLWLAGSQEGADQLLTRVEATGGGHPLPLLKLALPDRIEAGPKYVIDQVGAFHRQAEPLMTAVAGDLAGVLEAGPPAAGSTDHLLPGGPDYTASWTALVDRHFPAGAHGKAALTIYLLPGCSVTATLGLTTARTAPPGGSLLGIFRRRAR